MLFDWVQGNARYLSVNQGKSRSRYKDNSTKENSKQFNEI